MARAKDVGRPVEHYGFTGRWKTTTSRCGCTWPAVPSVGSLGGRHLGRGRGERHTYDGPAQHTVFDSSDGVRSNLVFYGQKPRVAKAADGAFLFLPIDGVSMVDPRRLRRNELPPPAYVEQVTADRAAYVLLKACACRRACATCADRLHGAEPRRAGEEPLPHQAGRARSRSALWP
jgi:hypothetical protein